MVTAFVRIRTLVLVAVVLFAGLAAIAPQTPQEAAAAGPCDVAAVVKYGVSNNRYYVYGRMPPR